MTPRVPDPATRASPMWKKRPIRPHELLHDPKAGRSYRVDRLIGRGAFAEVWQAECLETRVQHAVKFLQIARLADPKSVERQRREGTALVLLKHPNIVRADALVELGDGFTAVVMELLIGRTLGQLMWDVGPKLPDGRIVPKLPIPWALQILIKVCSALDTIHKFGIVHRDVKPENVHVGRDASVKLCDLGAGQFTREDCVTTDETTLGTLEFMSPEQLSDPRRIDGRSDLFTVGVVLYYAVAGVNPFAVDGAVPRERRELAIRIMVHRHTPLREVMPSAPDDLVSVIEQLLAKEPRDRFATAAIARDALAEVNDRFVARLAERDVHPVRLSTVGAALPAAPLPDDEGGRIVGASPNPFVSASIAPSAPVNDAGIVPRGGPFAFASTAEVSIPEIAAAVRSAADKAPPLHLAPAQVLPPIKPPSRTVPLPAAEPLCSPSLRAPGRDALLPDPARFALVLEPPPAREEALSPPVMVLPARPRALAAPLHAEGDAVARTAIDTELRSQPSSGARAAPQAAIPAARPRGRKAAIVAASALLFAGSGAAGLAWLMLDAEPSATPAQAGAGAARTAGSADPSPTAEIAPDGGGAPRPASQSGRKGGVARKPAATSSPFAPVLPGTRRPF